MYTIKQAAARSGVNVELLRAWERRYGVVAPTRTESGYRLYDDESIDRLRAMRALVDEGWSPRQAADRLRAASAEELGRMQASVARHAEDGRTDVETFVEGASRIDAAAIERALDEMFASGSFERVVDDRLFPALRAVGEAWERGEVDVAGEHAASAAVVRRLSMAFEAAASPSAEEPILVGLPPGSRHELAPLAFATAARRAGIPIVYLGPDVPVESWVAAVERTRARGVAIGVTTKGDVAAAEKVVRAVQAAHRGVVTAVGGRESVAVGNGRVIRLPDDLALAVEALRSAVA